jgi:hypothetical protein
MMSEPDPRYTLNGKQVRFPWLVFDCILHDCAKEDSELGQATRVNAAIVDWDLLGAPIAEGDAALLVLAVLTKEEFTAGRARYDLWMERARLKRGIISIGQGLLHKFPRPQISWLEIAPRDEHSDRSGIALDDPEAIWESIYGVFKKGYRGVLIADVWAGWKSNGTAFELLTEGDVEI